MRIPKVGVEIAPLRLCLRLWGTLMTKTTCSVAFGMLFPLSVLATPVFINEFHYDNAGTDVGEALEIAGPASTDLTGWSLVRYNGSNGLVYGSDVFATTIPNIGDGFGVVTINYPTNGLQNGSPDGFALVDATSNVVQFLSYEGSFTAVDGPAAGLTSTDIGVSEVSSTPIGASLQLTGTGSEFEDFAWSSFSASTFDDFNTGQVFTNVPDTTTLVMNEIDYDQSSTDTAEFVELLNVSGDALNLGDFRLDLINGSTDVVYDTINLPVVELGDGEYFVICANAATVINCDLDVAPDTNLIQNGAPDAIALYLMDTLVDTVSYEGVTAGFTEGTLGAPSDTPGVDFRGISRIPNGGDIDVNDIDFRRACITPGTANIDQDSGCVDPGALAVPAPATLALVLFGLAVSSATRRRKSVSAMR